jgi:hypothetical protein
MKQNYKRHRILVDREVQGGIAWRLTLHWVATAIVALSLTVLLQFFADPSTTLIGHLTTRADRWAPVMIAFTLTLPIAVLNLVRFAHNFAGPVVRLRRMMRELAAGEDVGPLKFRDGDCWNGLADDFNALLETMNELRAQAGAKSQAAGATQSTLAGAALETTLRLVK